jgi:hypothetical protein
LGVAAISEFLSKKLSPQNGAILATLIGLCMAPALMAKEGWNDHDRSSKTTPRDFAIDYLESCAPNAILFTYGDNDTYPIWYAQEVENIRPDVRVINLSLLGTDWYLRQLKDKINEAEPAPLSMPNEKFVQGVRDILYFQDIGLKEPVELKNLVEFLLSDADADKVGYESGEKQNFLPTKNFKLSVNPQEVLASGTLPATSKDQITPTMTWTYNKNHVTKDNLGLLDILAHNNWKRPIYFAITVPSDNYAGLDKYLYKEGFAYRLLPLQPSATPTERELLNTTAMYTNMMTKFRWGNMKNASYLDTESNRMMLIIINNFNILAEQLLVEGKVAEAKKTLEKCQEVVPDKIYSMSFAVRTYFTADLLYRAGETQKANALISKI